MDRVSVRLGLRSVGMEAGSEEGEEEEEEGPAAVAESTMTEILGSGEGFFLAPLTFGPESPGLRRVGCISNSTNRQG